MKMASLMVTAESPQNIQLEDNRFSRSECNSSSSTEHERQKNVIPASPFDFRMDLFKSAPLGAELTHQTNQRAVSWLATVCWSKNLNQECLWSSILLFYALKAQKKVKKENLELTLLTCLHLSAKLTSGKAIALRQLTVTTGKAISAQSIVQMQALILEFFNYNIVIPHCMAEIFNIGLTQDETNIVLFLCELLMLRNCQIFFDRQKIEKVIKLFDRTERLNIRDGDTLHNEIKVNFVLKQAKIIIKKYEPKFDIQQLMSSLQI